MADTIPSETETSTVELLIGNDYYLDIILSQIIEVQPGLDLIASKLGWIMTGRTSKVRNRAKIRNRYNHAPYLTKSNQSSIKPICLRDKRLKHKRFFTSIDDVTPSRTDLEDFLNIESIGVRLAPLNRFKPPSKIFY